MSPRTLTWPVRKAVLFLAGLVVALQLAFSLFAWLLAQNEIVPVLEQKAYATGLAEARRLTRQLSTGIAFEQLQGVQAQFDQTLQRNPDLAYIILTDAAGRIVVRSGSGGEVFTPERYSAVTREVERRLVTYGQVHVGIDRQFIVARMKAVRNQAITVLLASLALSALLAWQAARHQYGQPVGQAAAVLTAIAGGDFRTGTHHTLPALDRAVAALLDRINGAHAALAEAIARPGRSARALAAWEKLRAKCHFGPAPAGDHGAPAQARRQLPPG